jgi:hypothetical protein
LRVSTRRAAVVLVLAPGTALASEPWANGVVSYNPGNATGPVNPLVVLGQPERFTGEGVFPGAVTPFNPAFLEDEIVSVGAGGHLTVSFATPIKNAPGNAFGVDLIVFGNGGFIDTSFPNGIVGGAFADGPFGVEVSADGVNFFKVGESFDDATFPALGYLDLTSPYATSPGSVPSDFTKPIDPSLKIDDFMGKNFAQVLALYDGSGGGIPIDIGGTGLAEAWYVRISVPVGAETPEFDAFAVVPEPASAMCMVLVSCLVALRGRKS